MPVLKLGDREIDPHNMSKQDVLLFWDINPATLDEWVNRGAPHGVVEGHARFDMPRLFKWYMKKKEDRVKKPESESEENDDGVHGMPSSTKLFQMNQFEAYRKLKYQNDLTEGSMLPALEVKSKFFALGNMFKSIMKGIVPRVSASLENKTIFDIEQRLDKEIDESLNQFADLDYDNWGKDGR